MKPPSRTLVITSSYPSEESDAAGHFVAAEVRLLREAGQEVEVFTAGAGQSDDATFFAGGAELFSYPGAWPRFKARPTRLLALFAPSLRAFRRSRHTSYQRIVAHWLFPAALPWALLFYSRGTRLEVVMHGSDVRLATRLPRALLNACLELLARRNARLRFVSRALKEELLSSPLSAPAHTFVLNAVVQPAALDLPEILPRNAARQSVGISQETRLVAVVARLVSTKRVTNALLAAELIPDAQIIVLGDGPLLQELQAQFPHVRFLGQKDRKQALTWIRAADVLISASRLEGAPTAIREARQLGTPVVTVNAGDVVEWATEDPELYVVLTDR